MRVILRAVLAALVLAGSGCGTLSVELAGSVRTGLVEPAASSPERPVILAFDRLGNLTLNGQVLDLPSGREGPRFGLRVVDTAALPPVWRPEHAAQGGLIVASLRKASPLAIAGLRPFDRIAACDGQPLADAPELVRRLEKKEPAEDVRLQVVKPDGSELELVACAADKVDDTQKVDVPFLFERRASSTGHALACGPLDLLFYYRVKTDHSYVSDPVLGHSEYHDRFEWGALGNLFLWERSRNRRTGEERSRFRLLWLLSLGDEL